MRCHHRLALAASALALSAQSAPKNDGSDLVRQHTQAIVRDSTGSFSGAAWDALIADASGAQFAIVGEQHGSSDIAAFETALHRELASRGFTHSALEVGPWSTRFAETLIRSGPGRLHEFIAVPGHGFILPFLFYKEEADMAEQMVRSSPDRHQALFGLDQEFVGAAQLLATSLGKVARTAAQKSAVEAFASAASRDPLLVGKLDETQLGPLQKAFAGNTDALAIIEAMRISARIYKPFISRVGPTYAANLERETYMKRNFIAQFEAAKRRNRTAPKVFFKFGANHAMRGMSETNVPALGNFIAEWGLPQGYRMVNLVVDCIGGEATNPQTGKPEPCEAYFGSDTMIRRSLPNGPKIQILDLRALRPLLSRLGADDASRKIILAFDYYVAIKDAAPATSLGRLSP